LFLRDKEACLHASIGYPYLKFHTAVRPSLHHCIHILHHERSLRRTPSSVQICHRFSHTAAALTYRDYLTALTINYVVPES
jgi:hypothetical protein